MYTCVLSWLLCSQLELTSCTCEDSTLIEWARGHHGIKCWYGNHLIHLIDMECDKGNVHYIEQCGIKNISGRTLEYRVKQLEQELNVYKQSFGALTMKVCDSSDWLP